MRHRTQLYTVNNLPALEERACLSQTECEVPLMQMYRSESKLDSQQLFQKFPCCLDATNQSCSQTKRRSDFLLIPAAVLQTFNNCSKYKPVLKRFHCKVNLLFVGAVKFNGDMNVLDCAVTPPYVRELVTVLGIDKLLLQDLFIVH
jgi:hypothetical protein